MAPRSRRKAATATKVTDRDAQLLRRIYEIIAICSTTVYVLLNEHGGPGM